VVLTQDTASPGERIEVEVMSLSMVAKCGEIEGEVGG
jgi:hypothetical protein